MGYKTEDWQNIEAGDYVEVLHSYYADTTNCGKGFKFDNPVKVNEVCWSNGNECCLSLLHETNGGGWATLVGNRSRDQVRLIRKGEGNIKGIEGFNKLITEAKENGTMSIEFGKPVVDKSETIQKETPWNIRHFRQDKSKSSGVYSLTILWRQVGKKIEYRLAICSPNDNFYRKEGLKVAHSKKSDFFYNRYDNVYAGILVQYISRNEVNSKALAWMKELAWELNDK